MREHELIDDTSVSTFKIVQSEGPVDNCFFVPFIIPTGFLCFYSRLFELAS